MGMTSRATRTRSLPKSEGAGQLASRSLLFAGVFFRFFGARRAVTKVRVSESRRAKSESRLGDSDNKNPRAHSRLVSAAQPAALAGTAQLAPSDKDSTWRSGASSAVPSLR